MYQYESSLMSTTVYQILYKICHTTFCMKFGYKFWYTFANIREDSYNETNKTNEVPGSSNI